ncbi:hypothetical protein PAESOLCIP111_00019 [Paenibacillus solanacearum]|uniref:Uncharacterized protein n=1 Tax=Paenibacillus solanacearum TaxID=2048548 RepID=A0A916NJZ4_9BACL|nr:hypothetical protein PAESOLCIP111_00019 [Paenibacillus solanacearum]
MTLFGTITAIVVAVCISIFLGPYGIIVLISLTFGLVLSTHVRNKEIYSDLQRIKEKLGIEDKDDFNMSDEAIEQELEQYMEPDEKDSKTKNDL